MLVCQHWPTKRIQDGPVSVLPSFVICDGSSKSLLGLQIHTMENILKSNFWSEVFFKVKQMWCRWEQLESPVCKAVQRGCCLSPHSLLVQRPALHQELPSWVTVSTDLLFTVTYLAPQPLLVDLCLGPDFLLIIRMSSFLEISFYYCLGRFVLLLING